MTDIDYEVNTYSYTAPYRNTYWHQIKLTVPRNTFWSRMEKVDEVMDEIYKRVEDVCRGDIYTERDPYSGSLLMMFSDKPDFFLARLMV